MRYEELKNNKKVNDLINKSVMFNAVVSEDGVRRESLDNVITSDALVDIFDELYPEADELDERYEELRNYVLRELNLTIVPGEDVVSFTH